MSQFHAPYAGMTRTVQILKGYDKKLSTHRVGEAPSRRRGILLCRNQDAPAAPALECSLQAVTVANTVT
jgi:hypothetical protein